MHLEILFEVDCSKYTTSCSLSLDLMLKFTKIQLFKGITMFDFVNSSILGGLCVASENIVNDDDGKSTISSCDACSLYPYVMSQKLPISNYKFVSNFNKNKYGQDNDYSCLLNVEIYTTKKVLNQKTLSHLPALISKSIIKYEQLSEYQRENLKESYKSSQKLISHLRYDKNSYISFEMYEMLKSLGFKVNILKILEYKHSNFMKPYINFLFEKESYYKSIGDTSMSLSFKILMNSLFGVMMTRVERFENFKIVMNEEQVDKLTIKPNFISRHNVNENFSILEMEKLSVVYSYPILIASVILQNSKVHMYNYLYKIYPRLFGDDYKVLYMDTDSIYAKLDMTHEEYIKILENNKHLFGNDLGQIVPENLLNEIKEGIFYLLKVIVIFVKMIFLIIKAK